MNNYDFPNRFRTVYTQAVDAYARGQRNAGAMFAPDGKAWLAANGITPQHMFDYAEDHNVHGGEPGLEHALAIEIVRRDYFRTVQGNRISSSLLDEARLPAKDEQVRGIAWLPRLLPKTRAKLRGELPPSLMFCCGGDRRFFKAHDILPAEFMAVVWRHEDDEPAVVDWVVRQSLATVGVSS